ncbi:hypothetical protein FA10DRAFT_249354 [Acaromyces ingoldii]|uniref:Polymerase III polypeptide H n=1 Tax=Acaromyces ingoldii TaxID=215250 RepID=A0A316YR85_9BASI|nr:hypothetical protein FA10DRAFT_249354 [Acaromyces ingoldii]PWN91178.1 hypothetical protein FA10DRAFT_249354 [Acaromyces ingoldii]
MFNLSLIHDTIRIPPSSFSPNASESVKPIQRAINAKYANRILPDVGLCVSLFDLVSVDEGRVKWGDGCLYHRCVFRLVVFRPFPGEVLVGRVKSSDPEGLRLTMGFFDDVFVPREHLPEPSGYDHSEALWFWLWEPSDPRLYDDPLGSSKEDRLYIDTGAVVRFLVESDLFEEPEPPGPASWGAKGAAAAAAAAAKSSAGAIPGEVGQVNMAEELSSNKASPYRIKASISAQGFGPVGWWAGAQQEYTGQEEQYAGATEP